MRAVLFLLLCAGSAVQAQMYKCVDAKGVTHYSDKPRPDCRGAEVDIRPQPPISGKAAAGREDLKAAERDFQRRQIQRDKEEQAAALKLVEQRRQCARLLSEVQRYATQRRIPVPDAKGERTLVDDAAREAKIAELSAQISRQCP